MSKGGLNDSLKQLTPINQSSLFITDAQLAILHLKYDLGECKSLRTRKAVANVLDISCEIVHKWCEHIRYTYVKGKEERPRQQLRENKEVLYTIHIELFVCVCVCDCTCIHLSA